MKKILKFLVAMILAFIPGVIGVMFTPSGMSDLWYNALNRSVLTPAGWVFGVAWTVLYALIGLSLFLIMNTETRTGQDKTRSYVFFGLQMILNALWTYMFFGIHLAGWAFVVIAALIVVSVCMMRSFFSINRTAGYLLIPYIAWLLFAAYLNGVILYLN